jgi:hypothetical protein
MRKIVHPFWGEEDVRGIVIRWVISGLIAVAICALYVAFRHAHNLEEFGSRIVPGVLLSTFGLLGLANMAANVWLYRRCTLPFKGKVTLARNPLAYWLTFAVLTGLFLAALVAGVLFLTGVIHIHVDFQPA